MPIMMLLAGTAIAMGTAGVGIGAKGGIDQARAQKLNKNSNERMEKAAFRLEEQRKKCSCALQALGGEKLFVLNHSIRGFVDTFSKLKNVDFTVSEGLEELEKIRLDKQEFEEMQDMTHFSSSLLEGASAGAVGGALTAFGAYSAATSLATASTGTAIASLSGAAAKSATLAWFGGGSIASGGAGVAGGTAVLGGLVAGPALLIMGIIVGAKAGKNLENAKANAYQANETCEELENGALACIAIRRRGYLYYHLLARLDAYLTPLVYAMQEIVEKEGNDYSRFTLDSKKIIASAASAACSVKAVLDTPILTFEGNLTEESEVTAEKLLKEAGKKQIAIS